MLYSQSDQDRFWFHVDKNFLGCWLWTRTLNRGYGSFRSGAGKTTTAHRASYQMLKGAIPDGLQLDHLCRVRNCVNPDHLEPVTLKENVLRGVGITAENKSKTHCVRGHALEGFNLQWAGTQRRCRTCGNDNQRNRWRANNPDAPKRKLRHGREDN